MSAAIIRNNAQNEIAERLYWEFKALTDRTQTQPVMSERDAFKRVIVNYLEECALRESGDHGAMIRSWKRRP